MGPIAYVFMIIGVAAVLVVIVVLFDPKKAKQLFQKVEERNTVLPGRISSEASIDKQMADLRLNETAELESTPDALSRMERAVSCRGILHALNREGREFTDRGEQWQMLIFDGIIMLLRRPDGWFWFNQGDALILPGDSAREFDDAGIAFSQKGQVPRSVTFPWRGHTLSILDVGYLRFDLEEGECHIADQDMVKFLLAEDENGHLVYLENLKMGTDRVWRNGIALGMTIKPYVGKLLRATA